MPRKSQITVGSRAAEHENRIAAILRDNPALARRLQGNVFGGGSKDIPLKEPGRWYTRIDNTLSDDSRFYEVVHQLGYLPLKPEDLTVKPEEIGFRVSPDGNLVRGKNGEEMIFKMDVEARALLEAEMTRRNLKGQGSAKQTREALAEKVAGALGDEAASFMASQPGEVIDTITGV